MEKITLPKIRQLYALSKKQGIDNDLLHSLIESRTGKSSIKQLTVAEGNQIIDLLTEETHSSSGIATERQMKYISGLVKSLGWTDDRGKPDLNRLAVFTKERFQVDNLKWLDTKTASHVIEALKAMSQRTAI